MISSLKALFAKPWLLPDIALAYSFYHLARFARLPMDKLGWLQAILYSYRIDVWLRYASVIHQIRALDKHCTSILDVGAGTGIIEEFIDVRKLRVCTLDANAEGFARVNNPRLEIVVGDGLNMPFTDNSFDFVISVDCLEHVPDTNKEDFCRELKRVAKKAVIIHCPSDSSDLDFQSTVYDRKFLEWFRLHFNRDEPNTVEHLNSGLPKVEELMRLFPGAEVMGKQNADVWLKYMCRLCLPYVRFINGPAYKLRLEKKDNLTPYKSCLIAWKK